MASAAATRKGGPGPILPVWLARLRDYRGIIVPLAFVNYFPSVYILDKADSFGAPSWFRFMSPVAAALSVLVARIVWRAAIRHYRSAGS